MSENDSSEINSNNSEEKSIEIDENFIIKLTNENIKIINRNAKQRCKILQISSDLNIDQKLTIISALEPSEYPNLFMFIIEHQNGNLLTENQGTKLEEYLSKFGASRPLIIQQICESKNEATVYYKGENSDRIEEIDQCYSEDYEQYQEYKGELSSYDQELQPFEDELLKKLSYIQDSSIILRFLRTLNLDEGFFGTMVQKVAEGGSKADFLAILDTSFTNNGRILNSQAQDYIQNLFEDDESGSESDEVKSTSEKASDEEQDGPASGTSSQSNSEDSSQSVLLIAVQNSNHEIIDYLITYWTPLIQQLPVEHQITISTAAFDTNQFNILCDLLQICDFLFPENFTVTKSKVNERLSQITIERIDLKAAIECKDFKKIDDFINNNQNLKFVFYIDNNSVLIQAINAKNFEIFYYLKSLGFQGERCENVPEELNDEEKRQAVKQAVEQRRTNISKSLQDFHKSVLHLSARSLIHNRKISREKETEYRRKIRSWFKDIQKIAPEMLEVAASCEHLKIIFDFESHSVENSSLTYSNSSGVANATCKWIFIGAKFTDKASEQKIKGVLAHELCHYVMGMVYENQEFPYFKGDKQTEKIFKEIVAIIDKWSTTKDREPDDECNGIISTVYRLYLSEDFKPELFVRAVHILAHYDDNPEKLNLLQEIYQILFHFWYNNVVPDLKNHLEKNQAVIRLNGVLKKTKPNLNIFVDCTEEVPTFLNSILVSMDVNYIFVVSKESQCDELKDMIADRNLDDPINIDVNYNWMDLDLETQKKLLNSKINFQNFSKLSLCDILDGTNLDLIIDTQVLNMLMDKQKISINSQTADKSTEKYFEFLFQPRNFIDRNMDTTFSQEELLSDVKNKQYILISDIAGTGKSWIMKNISKALREQNPSRWMTYVDLKLFIKEFRDDKNKPEFETFFIENVLKSKTNFEIEVFKKLYKNGKVCILLDGFDEIAPDCAEFVANLAQSFGFNEGNQMWIATRDYFQVNLQQRLKIDAVYKLDKFTKPDGINFIVSSWVLSDLKALDSTKSKRDFDEVVKNSSNFLKYQQKASQIVRKVAMSSYNTIGLPQLFKMIADGFKDDKYTSRDLKGSKIFSKFAQKLYKKWTQETGQLRSEASIKCHEDGLNFWRLHYYFAVESLFPELVEVLFPDFDISEWPEEEVIACGFMTIIGGKFLFLHETFREYFLVDFIIKTLEKPKINGKIVELIVKILTIKKYEVVQLFLNDAIENHKVLDKILPEMQKYVDNFYLLDYFGEFFVNNLENLAYLLIKLLKNADYEKVKKMLEKSAKDIMKRSNDQKIVLKFQEFLVDFLNVEDLRKLLIKEELFHEIIRSSNNIEAFDDLVTKIESKVGSEIVQQGLMQMSSDIKKGNIFWFLCISHNINSHKMQKCLKIVQKFLSISEIMELIEKCNHKDQNVFEFMVEEDLEFRLFWEGCMDILRMEVALPSIKRMFKKSNSKEELLLHTAAEYNNLKFHEDLWEILLKAFDQHEELNDPNRHQCAHLS